MTTMIIDNKATAKKSYVKYIIDREICKTMEDLKEAVEDCFNEETYLIRVYEDDKLIIERRIA